MLSRLRSFVRALTGRRLFEAEMQDEMRFHMEAYRNDLIRSGVPADQAERRTRMEFGSIEDAKETCRESRGLQWPDEFHRNIRYAFRTLRRTPGFTSAAVVTLALCIGANTSVFSVIDAVLLRPLPFPHPERLVQIATFYQGRSESGVNLSQDGTTWEMLRDHATYLECAARGFPNGANVAVEHRAEYVQQERVSASYFHVLGIEPAMGRGFTPAEDAPGGPQAAVLSYELWMRLFHGDRGVLGRSILLRGEPHTVIGIMPERLPGMLKADLWTPLRPSRSGEGEGTNYEMIGRIKAGATFAQADSQAQAIGAQRFAQSRQRPEDARLRAGLVSLQSGQAADAKLVLLTMWGAAGLVLLIGCVNIAELMLVRAGSRTREIATRTALGGGRGAVIRQMLTESLVLALLGGIAGIGTGYAALKGLAILATNRFGIWQEMRLDGRVLLASALMALLTSVLFGLFPAYRATRIDIQEALAESGGRGVAGGLSRWPRRLMVLAEVALGFVLLIGAGLMIKTFANLNNLSPGFDGRNVLTADVSLQDARYVTANRVNWLFTSTLDRIRALPGIENAAVGLHVPYQRWLNMGFKRLDGPDRDTEGKITDLNYITPGYFATLRIPIVSGRPIESRDTTASTPVAVVTEAFVRRYLRNQEPLGSHLKLFDKSFEVVGVVGNVEHQPSWGSDAPIDASTAIYIPVTQVADDFFPMVHMWFSPSWVVRTSNSQEAVIKAMRNSIESVDPMLPFASFHTFDQMRGKALGNQRFQATLLATLAGLALGLAAVGIYGLIAHTVVQRRREIGIRLALGATVGRVIGSVAREGVALAAIGIVTGTVLAFGAVRVIQSSLWGVQATDTATYAGVAALLLLVAATASLIPALQLTRLNPANTLRDE